ncbi:hypothetical protein [Methylomonas sp. MgM2]
MNFQQFMRFAATAALGIPVLGCADYSFHDKTASESVELIKITGNGQNVSVFPPGLFDLVFNSGTRPNRCQRMPASGCLENRICPALPTTSDKGTVPKLRVLGNLKKSLTYKHY